jgi:uncharacterized protein DUF5060
MRVATLIALLAILPMAGVRAAGIDGLATPSSGWAVSLPGRAVRSVDVKQDWSGVGRLQFTVHADPGPTKPLRVMVSIVVCDGWWYQSTELVNAAGSRTHKIDLDLGHLSNDWTPRGHLRAWDGYARQRVRNVSVSLFSPVPYKGSIQVRDVKLVPPSTESEPKLFIYDAGVLTETPKTGSPTTFQFRLSKPWANPFEAGQVQVEVLQNGRKLASSPAYFYQDYRRTSAGPLKPVGASSWRATMLVPRAGAFQWVVKARDGKEVTSIPAGTVAVVAAAQAPPSAPGEALKPAETLPFTLGRRVRKREPVFTLVRGKWRWVEETPAEPLARAWRVPIEWTRQWGAYQGLGRYNLEAAWEFDQLLDKATAAGVHLPMALNADEPFQGQRTFNWFSNPLASTMGGPLSVPSHYFTDQTVEKYFKRRTSYIAARWGASPAVSRFELWMSTPANAAEKWHGRMAGFLQAVPKSGKAVVSRHPQGTVLGKRRSVSNFERQWGNWKAAKRISPTTTVQFAASPTVKGQRSLALKAGFPGEAAIFSKVKEDWTGSGRLVFDVYVPKGAPNDMRAMVYVRERDWWWYQTLLQPLLRPGDWTKLIVDISPESTIWQATGHKREWDGYVAQNIREMGIRIFGHKKFADAVYIDNIELWPDPKSPRPIKIQNFAANKPSVAQFEKLELSFGLSRVFKNPFDPGEADVRGHFVSPSGKHIEVPGFFYQTYDRKLVNGAERLGARNGSCWKVRFATGEMGAWTAYIKVNGESLMKAVPFKFNVTRSANPGYVRRSLLDPLYLEFTSGKFFYPIGHNLRSPSDGRKPYPYKFKTPEGKGTFVYDDYFKKMSGAGENMARIWMCSWWCGLEWNERWHGFAGVGRYNMENAWRLDHLVEEAAKRGIYIALDTTNHGQYSINIDHEWEHNPYNVANGGFLKHAREFFTDAKAEKLYKRRMRYTIARWGYSTSIMMWTIFSEVEFTEEYWRYSQHGANNYSPHVAPWHAKIARYIKSADPFRHLVTTHVSHAWRGYDVWSRPEMEVVQSNAYSKYPELGQVDVVRTLAKVYYDKHKQFKRPVLIAEYGGHWEHNTAAVLDAELHSGLWGTTMMPFAGNTGFWWWLHIHFADKYSHYRAVANYMKGEDRRAKGLVQANCLITSASDQLKAVGLQNTTSAYVWVYHQQVTQSLTGVPKVAGATLGLTGLKNGSYTIELWDTYKGVKSGTLKATAANGRLLLKLPTVVNDVALKIRFDAATAHTPSR